MTDAVLPLPSANPEQALIVIGDITMSQHWLVTPSGTAPLRGTRITVTDLSHTTSKIPVWAIVLAVIGAFFFLLGLLFLLVRETSTAGVVQVTVTNGPLVHMTQIAATSQAAVFDVHARVAYAQQLVAALG